MQHNIFAFTDIGLAPQFLSINHNGEGRFEVIARSAPMGDEAYGATAAVVLNAKQLRELAETLFSFACTSGA
jgi:hypothetical protein